MYDKELTSVLSKSVKPKQTRNRPDLQNFGAENMQPGDNTRFLRHTRLIAKLPIIDISDLVQVQSRIDWYFDHCETADLKPTVFGFCNAIGISRDTLNSWLRGDFRAGTHQAIVKRTYNQLAELWELGLIHNKANPVAAIFAGKNFFNMQDKCEYVLTPNQNQSGFDEDPETIRQRYLAESSNEIDYNANKNEE